MTGNISSPWDWSLCLFIWKTNTQIDQEISVSMGLEPLSAHTGQKACNDQGTPVLLGLELLSTQRDHKVYIVQETSVEL